MIGGPVHCLYTHGWGLGGNDNCGMWWNELLAYVQETEGEEPGFCIPLPGCAPSNTKILHKALTLWGVFPAARRLPFWALWAAWWLWSRTVLCALFDGTHNKCLNIPRSRKIQRMTAPKVPQPWSHLLAWCGPFFLSPAMLRWWTSLAHSQGNIVPERIPTRPPQWTDIPCGVDWSRGGCQTRLWDIRLYWFYMDSTNTVDFVGILRGVLVCFSDAVIKLYDQKKFMVERGSRS